MTKFIILLMLGITVSLTAAEQLLFTDSFKDGSLSGGTKWNPASAKQPWTVKDNFMCPSGKRIFDSVGTRDFKPIDGSGFTLKFSVKFASDEKNGNNRFSVMMRDSANSYSGYAATIAQGTSNNSNIEKITKGKRAEIVRLQAKNACLFPVGKAVEVVFALTGDVLTVTVGGKVIMEVKDGSFKRFDTIQFQERCKTPAQIQEIGKISLYTNQK